MDAEHRALEEFFTDMGSNPEINTLLDTSNFPVLDTDTFNFPAIQTIYSSAYQAANSTDSSIRSAFEETFKPNFSTFSSATYKLISSFAKVSTSGEGLSTLVGYPSTALNAILLKSQGEIVKMEYLNDILVAIQQTGAEPNSTDEKTAKQKVAISEQRYEESAHPDRDVNFYQSNFPLTRALKAPWLYALMFISTVITILSIGIFLRFANVELELKLPLGEGGSGFLTSYANIDSRTYMFLVGGGIAVGGIVAYLVYRYR